MGGTSSLEHPTPEGLACYPNDATRCLQQNCGVPCATAWDRYTDPGDFVTAPIPLPRIYSTGMRDILSLTYSYTHTWKLEDGRSFPLSASATASRRRTGKTVSFDLELGPVRNLRLDDQVLPWDSETTLRPKTIHWEAPSVGTPEYYLVNLVDIELPGSAGYRPTITASYYTHATSLTLPDSLFVAGHHYYFRVVARRDGRDFSEPRLLKSDNVLATGVFTSLFTPGQ